MSADADGVNSVNVGLELVLNQTNYTIEEAQQKLKEHNNDEMKVLYEYLGIDKLRTNQPKEKITKNQKIYKAIRTIMDKR
jgi:hypothetical protein